MEPIPSCLIRIELCYCLCNKSLFS